MILQRVKRLLRVSVPLLSTVLLTLPGLANAIPALWHSEWRPGWLPGDPAAADQNQPVPIWALGSLQCLGSHQSPGMFIAIDPVTRRPVAPSEEQKRGFQAQVERDALLAPAHPLQIEKLPGGGEIIHLNGQFQVYSIARRDAQGHIRTDCVPNPSTARKLLSEPAPSAGHWEEK